MFCLKRFFLLFLFFGSILPAHFIVPASASYSCYDEAMAIEVTQNDDLIVAGYSQGGYPSSEYVLIRYDPEGNEIWSVNYSGDGYYTGEAGVLALDSEENPVVSGFTELWNQNIVMNYSTVKFSPDGAVIWDAHYPYEYDTDWVLTLVTPVLAVGTSGDVYLGGYLIGQSKATGCFLAKYLPDGTKEWEQFFGTSCAVEMVGDSEGGVIVQTAGWVDSWVHRFDVDGNELWVEKYEDAMGVGVEVDENDNAYALFSDCRQTDGSGWCIANHLKVVKFDADGNEVWTSSQEREGYWFEYWLWKILQIELDAEGNALVSGSFVPKNESRSVLAAYKISTAGAILWDAEYDGGGEGGDVPSSLGVDSAGNLFVAGTTLTDIDDIYAVEDSKYLTVKISATGQVLWSADYEGPSGYYDEIHDLVVDGQDNVIVTGSAYGSSFGEDFTTIKYDPDGQELWVAVYNGDCSEYYDDDDYWDDDDYAGDDDHVDGEPTKDEEKSDNNNGCACCGAE
jgi:hypothetical protein